MNRTAIIGVLLLTAALLGGAVCCADAYDAQDTGDGSSGASYIFYVADVDGKLEMKQGTIGEFHTVTGSDTSWGTASETSWYVVEGSVSIDGKVTVSGDVNLILADGSSLTAGYIVVDQGSSITIYGQSEGTGSLVLEGGTSNAALGGDFGKASGEIAIHGGSIRAVSTSSGAGIGGGRDGAGTVSIYGGEVYAQSGSGAAIGGGHGATGDVTIYGGKITAFLDSTDSGAAIGDGSGSAGGGGEVTIYGGTVVAESYTSAAIGGAYLNDGPVTVAIHGGDIRAVSSTGAGIGGGNAGPAPTVLITGGVINAESGSGAGIGGGSDSDGGTITITGGAVTAVSNHAAGIGAGSYDREGGDIAISGGLVRATTNTEHPDIGGTGGSDGTFSTGENGSAVIFADDIGALDPESGDLSAIVFQNGAGIMYGQSVTPTVSFDLGDDTLRLGEGQTLVLKEGVAVSGSGGRIVSDGTPGTVEFAGGTVSEGILGDDILIIIPTAIEVKTDSQVFVIGDTAEITVTVTDAFGDPVSAGSVVLTAGGYTDTVQLTGGSCTFAYVCDTAGTIEITLEFPEVRSGNTTYTSSGASVEIQVNDPDEGCTTPGDTEDDGSDGTRLYTAVAIVVVLLAILIAVQVLANRKA